ncbi:probable cytochrome P450 6a14 isoform X2 [Hermetia illucens]|uniref:probable cytochrome P450 6a14 isoform X2 n=1 Tax=Hermetia illucens TaxID=343691 RepID=UPI0018CC15E3|nr:probable cytochrome P450 6a14 isoform X2 [Hermetia illucens]
MDTVVILASGLSIILVAILWVQKKFDYWRKLGIPYEEPHFFYGNLKGVGQYDHDGLLTQKFYKKHKGKGPVVGVYFFLKPVAILLDINIIKDILIKDFPIFHDRGIFYNERDDPLSAHLVNLSGDKWKELRNKFSPTFSSGKMKMMFSTMLEVAVKLEKKIDQVCRSGKELDIKMLMALFTVDVIGSCAFGLKTNSLEDENNEFFHIGVSVFDKPRHGTRVMFVLHVFREYARKLRIKLFRDEVTKFYSSIVRRTIDYRLANNEERNDFMQLLIELHTKKGKDNLPFNDIVAQAFVFHIAGFETSSATLQFCFYELASNPDIQDKLRHHINEVLEKHDGKLTYEAVMDMKYLDQVINETLRKNPPFGMLSRETTLNYKIPGTDCILEKGTSLHIPIYAIHHDPEFYPNPSKFNPDNFSEEAVKNRHPIAFLPFGAGHRACIGVRFGMMQVKLGVIIGLRKFKYTLSPKTRQPIKLQSKFFVAQPEGGIWLNIESVD